MLAEMALLQRLTLLLGQPGLSLAVALLASCWGPAWALQPGAQARGRWAGSRWPGPGPASAGATGVLALEAVALTLVWGPVLPAGRRRGGSRWPWAPAFCQAT